MYVKSSTMGDLGIAEESEGSPVTSPSQASTQRRKGRVKTAPPVDVADVAGSFGMFPPHVSPYNMYNPYAAMYNPYGMPAYGADGAYGFPMGMGPMGPMGMMPPVIGFPGMPPMTPGLSTSGGKAPRNRGGGDAKTPKTPGSASEKKRSEGRKLTSKSTKSDVSGSAPTPSSADAATPGPGTQDGDTTPPNCSAQLLACRKASSALSDQTLADVMGEVLEFARDSIGVQFLKERLKLRVPRTFRHRVP
jgi:hypothetical protein